MGNGTCDGWTDTDLCKEAKIALQRQGWGGDPLSQVLDALRQAVEQLSLKQEQILRSYIEGLQILNWTSVQDLTTLILEGFLPATKILLNAEEWDADNDIVTLITKGFAPAANALKGLGWSAGDVATLVKERFAPAANELSKLGADKVAKRIADTITDTINKITPAALRNQPPPIQRALLYTVITLLEKWWEPSRVVEFIMDDLVPAANVLSNLGDDKVATLIKDGFAPAAIVLKPKHAAGKLKNICSSTTDFSSCVQLLLKVVRSTIQQEQQGKIQKAICNSAQPLPIQGALLYAAITLLGEGWTPNEVAKLIKDGFTPAANALKTKWNNADDVATLITQGFTPAAKNLKENRENKWRVSEITQLILYKNSHGLVPVLNALNGLDMDRVVTLIQDGFVSVAMTLKPSKGWGTARIATLISSLSNIAKAMEEWQKEEIITFFQEGIIPAATMLGPCQAANKLGNPQCAPENKFCNCVQQLFEVAIEYSLKNNNSLSVQSIYKLRKLYRRCNPIMRIASVRIQNFRSIRDIEFPLHNYSILIGKNNSGKSSALLALKLLLGGTTRDLREEDFHFRHEEYADQIIIEAVIDNVRRYLPLCNEKHRTKIERCITENKLRIRRVINRSPLKLGKLELWQPDKQEFGLPTGIESALKQILPEVIFIEAFKDPVDETKTSKSSTLSKILKHIVEPVSNKLGDEVKGILGEIEGKLNITEQGKDKRPEEIQRVEKRIRSHIQSLFNESDVRLRFTVPDVSDLVGSATIEIRDKGKGPWTLLDGKGQGLQRTLYLSLLRALAEEMREDTQTQLHRPFILLFEEPEAFLHPTLQKEMGNVLESISQDNQVVITTHSPLLVSPKRIPNVLILRQIQEPQGAYAAQCFTPNIDENSGNEKPTSQLFSLFSLSNSAEFLFADRVLVVEGISDRVIMEASWEVHKRSLQGPVLSLAVIDAGGKGNVPEWLKYLRSLKFPCYGLVDLDFLWNGAGKCLSSDPGLSQFNSKLQSFAGTKKKYKRIARKDLRTEVCKLRKKLREQHNIWVLSKGEIEDYTSFKKEDYLIVAQKIREGEKPVPPELKKVLEWVLS